MKIFKGFGLGALIGLGLAIVISLFVIFLPGLECLCHFAVCDLNDACDACDRFLACEGTAETFDYKSTFIFSALISTSVGLICGIAGTISDANEASKVKKEIQRKDREKRYTDNKAEMDTRLKDLLTYSNKQKSTLSADFSGIQYHWAQQSAKSESIMNSHKQALDRTEKMMNTLTTLSDKKEEQ